MESYVSYQVAPIALTLSYLDGQFNGLKPL